MAALEGLGQDVLSRLDEIILLLASVDSKLSRIQEIEFEVKDIAREVMDIKFSVDEIAGHS